MTHIRKKEYIEKYGEKAWEERKEKRNSIQRKWREKNKDYANKWRIEHNYVPPRKYDKKYYIEKYGEDYWAQKLEKGKKPRKDEFISKYGEDAWMKVLENSRRWKTNNKEKHIEQVIQWQKNNKEKVNDSRKRYIENHRDLINSYARNRRSSKNGRAYSIMRAYKQSDELANRGECTITKDWILEHIFNSFCIYCGDSNWKHLGCDRIDNSKPHTPDNVVCSCGICNFVRNGNGLSVDEMIEYRKTHPRDEEPKKLEKVVEINGKKVIRKVL